MSQQLAFWKLAHLSDQQLLDSLGVVLLAQRRALAALVAHLGEVEERRLHLRSACSSMFAYCVERLGMSEDEACRRIELARLARRFPKLFGELESGQITLSVALVLKPVLSEGNHLELLAAARGKSMRQARELLAARFPSADVPSSVRKLPERRVIPTVLSEVCPPAVQSAPTVAAAHGPVTASATDAASLAPSVPSGATFRLTAAAEPPPASRSRIDPLSAERYRVQFTADAALKIKLELARDLLHHAHPDGDLAPVVNRALDLLIADLQKRRFGLGARRRSRAPSPDSAEPLPSTSSSRYIRRFARRIVLDRDGLGCSWVDESGARCGSRAWLELDHRHPAGKGGRSEADNVRLLCRAHNQLAAEQSYGRQHIERCLAARNYPPEPPE